MTPSDLRELIRSVKGARNHLVCLENLSDEELAELEKEFTRLRETSPKPPKTAGGSLSEVARPRS